MSSVAEQQRAWRSPRRHFIAQNSPVLLSVVILVAALVAYYALYFRQLGKLPDIFDFTTVVDNALPLVFVGLGQTIVVVTRGLDLSVGGVLSISVALAATQMSHGVSILVWCVAILLIGAVAGLVNGVLVAYARLAPILVTLATLSIFDGLAIMLLPKPGGQIPTVLTNVLTNPSRPYGLVFLALALLVWFVLRRSSFGVALFAAGNDETAATANGIDVRRTKMWAYVVSGVCAAAGGLFFAARTTSGDAGAGTPFVLTSIAAVFLGGATLAGGRASAFGTTCGAIVLTLIVNVLFFAHVNPLYQPFYEGLLLVIAVVLGLVVGRVARSEG
jgi:ribose transport system permease protein